MVVVPVLNGGVAPSFNFQKFSRWYSAHWGVDRFWMLGFAGSLIVQSLTDFVFALSIQYPSVRL